MCGVAAGFRTDVASATGRLAHRGPDASGTWRAGDVSLAHTRLAILDLDRRSDQPFRHGSTVISFNGEIWNFREVRRRLEAEGVLFVTQGDTEVVAAALDRWEAPTALRALNGMFAVAWTNVDGTELNLARDRFGEVPLHVGASRDGGIVAASERKGFPEARGSVGWVGPGEHVIVSRKGLRRSRWYVPKAAPVRRAPGEAAALLRQALRDSTAERTISDVPVCTLLSGGVDSAVVAAGLLAAGLRPVAYTAVMDPRSPDLRGARETADSLGLELREVPIPAPSSADLASVVRAIEMPHKAQIEIGWPCLVLARRMRADGFRVTFSGEGSDELWASYGFAYHGLKTAGWHEYRRDLFLGQHRKNFPRANKAFLAHGVECRLPFLNPTLVELALSIPRDEAERKHGDKHVLREAARGWIPERVRKSAKLAFQDGLGLKKRVPLGDPTAFYRAEFATAFGSEA